MKRALIKPLNFVLNPPHNSPLPNRIITKNHQETSVAIQMIAFRRSCIGYTSLKDLIPASPPSTPSRDIGRRDSWREIPIKDPLLQHAAWAYLQPMAAERDEDCGRWWRRLKEKFCGLFGCFNGVVFVVFESWFSERRDGRLMMIKG